MTKNASDKRKSGKTIPNAPRLPRKKTQTTVPPLSLGPSMASSSKKKKGQK